MAAWTDLTNGCRIRGEAAGTKRADCAPDLADFDAPFHDVRGIHAVHDPASYEASQRLAHSLLRGGSNGVAFRSVRYPGSECLACFRPKLVRNIRPRALRIPLGGRPNALRGPVV